MKIGIVGCGMMGSTLHAVFGSKGHEVVLGVRNEDSPNVQNYKSKNPEAVFLPIEDAITASEVVFLALPFAGSKDRVAKHGDILADKIIVDCANPWPLDDFKDILIREVFSPDKELKDPDEPTSRPFEITIAPGLSAGEEISKLLEGGRFVKAFNQTGVPSIMQSEYPGYNGLKQVMYICGNDKEANATVKKLAADIGFDAFLVGDMTHAGILENLALLNAYSMIKATDYNMAHGLMRR